MVVERFLDALCLAACLGLAAAFVPLPKNLLKVDLVLSAIVLPAARTIDESIGQFHFGITSA